MMEKKLKATKAATICYGFGDLASQFVWTYVGSYLTIYYTDIVGLAPAAVSVIMMLARIWDAINDPIRKIPPVCCIWCTISCNLQCADIYESVWWQVYCRCDLGSSNLHSCRDAVYIS